MIKKTSLKYLPHFIVLFRVILVFVIIILFCFNYLLFNAVALYLLLVIAFLDWFDGYSARKLKVNSKIGGLVDTLGDRITENCLLIFFAYKHLILIAIPIIFVTRSFISDFIRYQLYKNNIDTFSVNSSKLGFIFVASKTSRSVYLALKVIIFLLGGVILLMEKIAYLPEIYSTLLINLRTSMYFGAILLVISNLIRFILLVYDSRLVLKKAFVSNE